MSKPPLNLALATGLLLANLAACPSAWPAPACGQAAAQMLSLTSADDGRSLDIRQGSEIELTLRENASTGFRWSLAPLDPALVELVSEQSLPNPGGGASSPGLPPPVGSPGQVVYRFKALSPGRTQIKLNHLRSWEGDPSTIDRFRLSLRIHAKSANQNRPHPTMPGHP